jgi:hypothetical protein
MINIEFTNEEVALLNELFVKAKYTDQYKFDEFVIINADKVHNLFIECSNLTIGINKFDLFVLLKLLIHQNNLKEQVLLERLKPYEYLLKNENNDIFEICIILDKPQINTIIASYEALTNSGHWGSSSFSTPEEQILINKLNNPNINYYSFSEHELKLINIWFENQYGSNLNVIPIYIDLLLKLLKKYENHMIGLKSI